MLQSLKTNKLVVSPAIYTLFFSAYFTFILNLSFWQEVIKGVEELDTVNVLFVATIPLTLWALLGILLLPLCIKHFQKPILLGLCLAAAAASFATQNYGIVFDSGMVSNIFETSPREAASYLNASAMISIWVLMLIPILVTFFVKIDYPSPLKLLVKTLSWAIFCLVLLAINAGLFYPDYASFFRNNNHVRDIIYPTSFVRQTARLVRNTYLVPPPKHVTIGGDAYRQNSNEARIFVVVLGETARAMNYPAGGYERNTTSHTSGFDMIHFASVSACGTATTISLPCMFSSLDMNEFDKTTALHQDNILDLAQRANYNVKWIENSDGCKDVCLRVNSETISPALNDPMCDGTYCFDEILINRLENELERATKSKQDTLIVLHVMGSHGPTYYRRYPDEHRRFVPDCRRSDIQNCTKTELVNTYDNTILYTDFVVASSIERLSSMQMDTSLMYISDHGESLGEKGIYLHGLPYALAPKEQTEIPWQMWFSPTHLKNSRLNTSCLKNQAQNMRFSHDNLFHTMLSITGISTSEYNQAQDALAPCLSVVRGL